MKLLAALFVFISISAEAARIKDIANVRGVRENQLVGYGLIVGLNGTGDAKTEYTTSSFARMLETLGMKLTNREVETKNIAAVIVTATLPAFARAGNKVDVQVNSIGSATSLQGGTLLQTPLRAADQQVYAVAQGQVLVSTPSTTATAGTAAGAGVAALGAAANANAEKAHLTTGRVSNGAIIETDVASDFTNRRLFRLTLQNPDFTTAARMTKTINEDLGGKYASAKDAGTIDVITPANYDQNPIELLANIENLNVESSQKAKVVVNEKTGTVIIGEHVEISTIALSHAGLNIQVKESVAATNTTKPALTTPVNQPEGLLPQPSIPVRGPASLAAAQTSNKKPEKNITVLKKSANVGELVKALNALGVTPKDLIGILQSMKAAGALHGELEVL